MVKIQKTSKRSASELVLCDVQVFARNVSETGIYEANPAAEGAALKQALKLFSIIPEYHGSLSISMGKRKVCATDIAEPPCSDLDKPVTIEWCWFNGTGIESEGEGNSIHGTEE